MYHIETVSIRYQTLSTGGVEDVPEAPPTEGDGRHARSMIMHTLSLSRAVVHVRSYIPAYSYSITGDHS